MNSEIVGVIILIVVIAGICLSFWRSYQRIIDLKQYAEKAYANIDVLFLKRAELIPQLIKISQKHQALVSDIQMLIMISQRSGQQSMDDKIEDYNAVSSWLQKFLDHASDESQEDIRVLLQIEDGIDHRISFYNESVEMYNQCLTAFPHSLFAQWLDLKPMFKLMPNNFLRKGKS